MQYFDTNSDLTLRNLLFVISYDGRNYHGWQVQSNSRTVQGEFQKCLEKIVGKVDIKGCSRTDSGVHAYNYCLNFTTNKTIPCDKLKVAVDNILPNDIAVIDVKEVPLDFHARYSNSGKEYIYKIWNCETKNPFLDGLAFHHRYLLDVELLNLACKEFIGKHDFTSFCSIKSEVDNNIRMVYNASVYRENNMVYFKVSADGFLYNMVRIMVGTLLRLSQKIALHQIDKSNIDGYITEIIEKKDRKYAGSTAQPCGLYLNRVFYKEGILNEECSGKVE